MKGTVISWDVERGCGLIIGVDNKEVSVYIKDMKSF